MLQEFIQMVSENFIELIVYPVHFRFLKSQMEPNLDNAFCCLAMPAWEKLL